MRTELEGDLTPEELCQNGLARTWWNDSTEIIIIINGMKNASESVV